MNTKLLKFFLPKGRRPRTVLAGLLRGLRLDLDLQSELLVWLGLYECELTGDIRRLARGCRGALDLGASRGELAVWLLRQPGMEQLVAVEPLTREHEPFRRNLALNGLAADPRLTLLAVFAGPGDTADNRTLADLAADLPAPLFIKIDIDGPEADVLASGREILARRDCCLVIETHSPEAEAGCVAQLISLGYQTRINFPARWRAVMPERRILPHNRWLVASRTEGTD